MDDKMVQSVNREIYRRFPELRDCKPKVQAYRPGKSKVSAGYVLSYSRQAEVRPGSQLTFNVRVVTDELGKIVKITASH